MSDISLMLHLSLENTIEKLLLSIDMSYIDAKNIAAD